MLKILAISPGGMGPHYHGPGIALYRLLTRLTQKVSVDIVHGSPHQTELSDLPNRSFRYGMVRGLKLSSLIYILGACWHVLRHRRQYDVVLLSMCNILTLLPGSVARKSGLPVILRVAAIGEISTDRGGIVGRRLKRSLIAKANGYLAISGAIERELRHQLGPDSTILLVPNGVDIRRFSPVSRDAAADAARALGVPHPEDFLVVCVGAICQRKGQKFLIEALTELPKDVSILLVGPIQDTKIWADMEAIIAQNDLRHRVTHIPFMSDIERAYQAAQVFILPSIGEGMPNAMVEAMSSGLVPLGTKISGIEDLIVEGCGRFITRDSADIATALRAYHADPALLKCEQDQARNCIIHNNNADTTAKCVLNFLRRHARDV